MRYGSSQTPPDIAPFARANYSRGVFCGVRGRRMKRVTTRRDWGEAFALLAKTSALVVLCAASASTQQVRIRVTSDTVDTPVPQALVALLNDRALFRTDDDGMVFVRTLHPGANVFTLRHLGLAPVTVTLNVPDHGTLAVHVIMKPAPQVLDTVAVRASGAMPQLSAFDERRLHSVGGHFITWADIQVSNPSRTLQLLRNQLGIRVSVPNDPSQGDPIIESSRGGVEAGVPCAMRIGMDGIVFGTSRVFDVNYIMPHEIYGIEIYDGAATIPAQYLTGNEGGSCGLIMIWTLNGAHQSAKRP